MSGLTKVGDDYYYFSTTNGKMRRSQTSQVNIVAVGCDLSYGVYTFGADGKVVIELKNGIIGDYYYVDGIVQMSGLTKVGDDYYYFSTTNGKMRKNQTSMVNYIAEGCDLPYGVYTFGADGKVVIEVKNGIIGDYYYVDGIVQMTGLTKVGDDYYYFSTTNGKMRRSQTSQVNIVAPGCDLSYGVYTFDADGKVILA
jgi:glucan-binding YG repeat protein